MRTELWKPSFVTQFREFINDEYEPHKQSHMDDWICNQMDKIKSPRGLNHFYESLIELYTLHAWTDFKLRGSTYYLKILTTQHFNVSYRIDYQLFHKTINRKLKRVFDKIVDSTLKKEACKIIQKAWMKCYYNPEYLVCKNRLMREYKEYRNYSVTNYRDIKTTRI